MDASMTKPPPLSAQESRVLRLCSEGRTDKEIASEIGISPRTVQTYINRILLKTGSSRRQEACRRQFIMDLEAGDVGFPVPITHIASNGSTRTTL